MGSLLLAVIYLIFISLGLPDSLLGSGWPKMQTVFGVPSSYAGYVSMAIAFMTIISALISPRLMRKFHTKWIVIVSIALTVLGLLGFSVSARYWMLFLFAVPYGLGAGSIDAAVNHYVADNYPSSVMNFLHCFYGVGAVISPNIMALALKRARWNEGYRWTAYLQIAILIVCIISLPLWKQNESGDEGSAADSAGIRETLKVPGVVLTLIAFFAYCSGEATCFLWTPSYFAGTRAGLTDGMVASFGSLVFGGLMLGRLLAGFVSNRLGDRKLVRIGIAVELAGIFLVFLPSSGRGRLRDDRYGDGPGLSGDTAYGAVPFRETLQRGGDRPSDGVGLHRQHVYADGVRAYPAEHRDRRHAGVPSDFCGDEHRLPRGILPGALSEARLREMRRRKTAEEE